MDLKTLVKIRGTATASVTRITSKWKNILEENSEEKEDELMIILQNLREKQSDLKQMNREVIMLLDEEELEDDAVQCEEIEYNIRRTIQKISKELQSIKINDNLSNVNNTSCAAPVKAQGMKLPKFNLTSFNGDPLKWTTFIETFTAAVDSQNSLTAIEKFTYLRGQLKGPAADFIQGFSLTSKNYKEAKKLLEERFGNPQAIIHAHMNVLLKLPKLHNDSVSRLSSLYSTIETNICSLLTMGLNPSHYGPLLIPVILERLPDAIKLLLTSKLGKNNWKILELVECIKEEVDARENCEFSNEKLDEEYCRKTTHSLVVIQKPSRRNCVFCGKSHYSDKCENITDIAIRKKILREEKRCFKCLLNGHVIKNCRANYKCFNCQGKNHHTAICDRLKCIKSDAKETEIVTANDGNKNEENISMLVDSKTRSFTNC